MSIYKPNLWLNQWYRGENAHFTYLKNLNSHEMQKNQWKGKISTSEHQNKHFYATNQHFFYSKTWFSEVVLKRLIISNVKFCDINFGEERLAISDER